MIDAWISCPNHIHMILHPFVNKLFVLLDIALLIRVTKKSVINYYCNG